MKALIYCLALLFGLTSASAQIVMLSPGSLDFGDVFTDSPGSLTLEIENSGSESLTIRDIEIFHPAFSLSDTAFTLAAGATEMLTVSFAPRHNVPHNTELVIVAESFEGQLGVDVTGRGVYPDSYYDPTQDLSGEALEAALSSLISGHNSLGYSPARDEMFMVIDNEFVNGAGASQNRLITAYTGREVEGYTSRSDAQTNYSVNTEHTWPQSMFGSADPMQSDIFHLFVTDMSANSTRGNLPFGNVTTPDWTDGGSKRGGGLFEPRDEQKGKTARAMLYFYIRYGNLGSFLTGAQEDVLREWHVNFPPDSAEWRRNEDISAVQFNRNPMIDHPEFIERISDFLGTSVDPVVNSAAVTVETVEIGEVMLGASRTYDLVIVADGTEDVDLNAYSVDHPDFSFPFADASIPAGESGILRLEYQPTSSGLISTELEFSTSADNLSTLILPLSAGAVSTSAESVPVPQWQQWMEGSDLVLRFGVHVGGLVEVHDMMGKLLASSSVEDRQTLRLALPYAGTGIYLVTWKNGEFSDSRRILISR